MHDEKNRKTTFWGLVYEDKALEFITNGFGIILVSGSFAFLITFLISFFLEMFGFDFFRDYETRQINWLFWFLCWVLSNYIFILLTLKFGDHLFKRRITKDYE